MIAINIYFVVTIGGSYFLEAAPQIRPYVYHEEVYSLPQEESVAFENIHRQHLTTLNQTQLTTTLPWSVGVRLVLTMVGFRHKPGRERSRQHQDLHQTRRWRRGEGLAGAEAKRGGRES